MRKIIKTVKKIHIYFFLTFRTCVLAARKPGYLYMEVHQRVWWSPYATTRIYPDGSIEPVYGGEWFRPPHEGKWFK